MKERKKNEGFRNSHRIILFCFHQLEGTKSITLILKNNAITWFHPYEA